MRIVHGEIRIPRDLSPEFTFKGIHSEVRFLSLFVTSLYLIVHRYR